MDIEPRDITGALLAGGQGERMGGADKGLLEVGGRALAARALEALRPQVGALVICANRNLERYAAFGCPVLTDALPGFQGPLAGMAAALAAATSEWVQFLPCDCPAPPTDLVARLAAAAGAGVVDVAVPRAEGRLQPVFALVRRRCLGSLTRALARGERKVERWLAGERWVEVDFSDTPAGFRNLNTPAEREALAQSLP